MSEYIPKVSIGVPIYNRETYIKQCVSSLFDQTYANIEYVFVDDCSTDNSIGILEQLLEKYPERKNSVRIIHHEVNGGLWKARNSCIENMTGDFFMFCDADDWIDRDAVSNLVKIESENHSPVVCTPLYENTEKGQYSIEFNIKDREEFDLNNIPLDVQHFSLCGKLFQGELFKENELRVFDGVNCWEDLCIVSRIFAITKNVILINGPFYHYRKTEQESLTRSKNKTILEQHLVCAEKLIEWFKENRKEQDYAEFLKFLKFTAKIKMLRGRDKQVKRWKETYPESNVGILRYRFVPFGYKILFMAVRLLPVCVSQGICNLSKLFYKK